MLIFYIIICKEICFSAEQQISVILRPRLGNYWNPFTRAALIQHYFYKVIGEHSLFYMKSSRFGCIFITLSTQRSQRWRNSEDKLMSFVMRELEIHFSRPRADLNSALSSSQELSASSLSLCEVLMVMRVCACGWGVRRQTRVRCTLRRWTPRKDATVCLGREKQSGKKRGRQLCESELLWKHN